MNERIKQFADQCRGDPMTSAFEPRFDKEKFAELIVKECSQMVHNSHPHDLPFVGGKMLLHFGVE